MAIKTRIVAAVVSTMTLVLIGLGTLMYYQVVDTQLARLDARLESHGEKLGAELEENKTEHNFPDIPSLLGLSTEGLGRTAIRLLDSTGSEIYADSLLHTSAVHRWSEITSRLSLWETIDRSGHPYRSYWMPVEIDDQYRYALQVVVALDELNSYAATLRLRLIFIIPLLSLLSGFAVYGIVRSAFRPIAAMIETAEKTSASDMTRRVALGPARDEVHALGAALNTMMGRIDSAFRAQKQFIADASHEIRTPLTIIQSETEFTRQRVRDGNVRKSLGIVLNEIEHLRKLSADLLLITKLDSPRTRLEMRQTDLNEVVSDCVVKMQPSAKRRSIALSCEESSRILLEADGEKVRSVVLNLLDNAIRYSGRKCNVRIAVGRDADSAVITVEDNGAGIPAEDLPHIFDRFHRGATARAGHTGNGLGLSIVARIVELHEGTISAESSVGHGSRFVVRLPLRRAATA